MPKSKRQSKNEPDDVEIDLHFLIQPATEMSAALYTVSRKPQGTLICVGLPLDNMLQYVRLALEPFDE